jgi:hypothetical protein
MSTLLLEYKDDMLTSLIYKPLKELLTAVSKYNTLPVGVIQFLISRINLQPTIVLSVYDDKKFVSSLCGTNTRLNTAIASSLPDVVNPTILIFPTAVRANDIVYNYGERYYYSSAFLIDFKSLKTALDNEIIKRYTLYTNRERLQVTCNLEVSEMIGLHKFPELQNIPIKLPFRNFIKNNPLYEGIIKSFMEEKEYVASKEDIEMIYNTIKDTQSYEYNGIQLYKDFIKLKPNALSLYTTHDTAQDHQVRTVCLKMDFNSKLSHLIFYRYIEGVVNTIIGTIDEARHE